MTQDSSTDMELFGGTTSTKLVAIGTILAAAYAVVALLPMSTFLASTGVSSFLSFSICIAPLFGIMLGPWRGFVYGLIGGFIATLLSAVFAGGIYLFVQTALLGPAFAGLVSGLSMKNEFRLKSFSIPGPLLAGLYMCIIILIYLIPNSSAWWFITPYALAAGAAFAFQIRGSNLYSSHEGWKRFLPIIPLAFIGTMADQSMLLVGSMFILGLEAAFFGYIVFPAMIVERIVATLISSMLIYIILTAFRDEDWLVQ